MEHNGIGLGGRNPLCLQTLRPHEVFAFLGIKSRQADWLRGQVWAGFYVLRLPPFSLGILSSGALVSNGVNMVLINGPVGSNCLIEASSDLSSPGNWYPKIYLLVTNSMMYFMDTSATNFSQQYYRAVIP
jgi:hypothetical protein